MACVKYLLNYLKKKIFIMGNILVSYFSFIFKITVYILLKIEIRLKFDEFS